MHRTLLTMDPVVWRGPLLALAVAFVSACEPLVFAPPVDGSMIPPMDAPPPRDGPLPIDTGVDTGVDAHTPTDVAVDAGAPVDTGTDAGTDTGTDAGTDSGRDAGSDSGMAQPTCDAGMGFCGGMTTCIPIPLSSASCCGGTCDSSHICAPSMGGTGPLGCQGCGMSGQPCCPPDDAGTPQCSTGTCTNVLGHMACP